MTKNIKNITLGSPYNTNVTNSVTVGAIGSGYTIGSPFNGTYDIGINGTGSWISDITTSGLTGASSMNASTKASLKLQGENADIEINGASLKDFMKKVEDRLALLTPDIRLESEWQELKELGDQYRALEKHILEKSKTWDILKKE